MGGRLGCLRQRLAERDHPVDGGERRAVEGPVGVVRSQFGAGPSATRRHERCGQPEAGLAR